MSTIDTLPVDRDDSRRGDHLIERRFVPTEIELFMYCAATWNTHRIHYDRDYARLEGYRDLVVPGPMQAARLGQMVAEFAAANDGRLAAMSVRHHAPLYCNDAATMHADVASLGGTAEVPRVELALAVVDVTGAAATSGTATLVLSGSAQLLRLVDGGLA
jgi:hydroxyacyl-ACP dehydratase HTD2-like protein with hotdog domain